MKKSAAGVVSLVAMGLLATACASTVEEEAGQDSAAVHQRAPSCNLPFVTPPLLLCATPSTRESCINAACSNSFSQVGAYFGCCETGLNGPIAECVGGIAGNPHACDAAQRLARDVAAVCAGSGSCLANAWNSLVATTKTQLEQAGNTAAVKILCGLWSCNAPPTSFDPQRTKFVQDPRCPVPQSDPTFARRVFTYVDSNGNLQPPQVGRTTSPTGGQIASFSKVDGVTTGDAPPITFGTQRVSLTDWAPCPTDARFEYQVQYAPRCSVELTADTGTPVGVYVATSVSQPAVTNAAFTGTPADLMASASLVVRIKNDVMTPPRELALAALDPWAFRVRRMQEVAGGTTFTVEEVAASTRYFSSTPSQPLGISNPNGLQELLPPLIAAFPSYPSR